MVPVYERLSVGDESACRTGVAGLAASGLAGSGLAATGLASAGLAVVHACKSPCHQRAVGYRGSLAASHANYLSLRRGQDLYLNLIDPPLPLFQWESFQCFLEFALERYAAGDELLIHCNRGESRSPSLALLFLSKGLGVIPGESFAAARPAFERLYGGYKPGASVVQFLTDHWGEIG